MLYSLTTQERFGFVPLLLPRQGLVFGVCIEFWLQGSVEIPSIYQKTTKEER